MKQKHIYSFILGILLISLLGSCKELVESTDNYPPGKNEFLTTPPSRYTIEMTRCNNNGNRSWLSNDGDITATMEEGMWTNVSMTRNTTPNERVEWEDATRVGLYLVRTDGTVGDTLKNIPINPKTHAIYKSYCLSAFNLDTDNDEIVEETTPVVDGAAYFWNVSKWSKGSYVSNTVRNFYAFYPRPYDVYLSRDWQYTRNSIVDIKKLNDTYDWNIISYDFWTNETDENLHQFDLMYSLSETDGVSNRYGNKNKEGNSSIQLPFLHAFCFLDINIEKENYQGDFSLSSIDFSGANVSTSGKLNIQDGTLEQSGQNGTITKTIDPSSRQNDSYNTSMIVPPTSGDVDLICNVDGAKYKCTLRDVDMKSGYKYTLDLKMRASGDIYLQVWSGATVSINGSTISGKEHLLTDTERQATSFTVTTSNDYIIRRVLKNGKEIKASGTDPLTYDFDNNPKEKTYYTIVTEPNKWYIHPDHIRIQYDGLRNNPYVSKQDNTVSSWTDLSGHGYDGLLENFNLAEAWSGKGLTFDGVKSIVSFPGTINPTEYTMEFYIFMEENQNTGGTPRLIAEGTDYPAYYFRSQSAPDYKWRAGLYGHGNGYVGDMPELKVNFGQGIMQLDFVYFNKKLDAYLTCWENGEKVQRHAIKTDLADDARSIPKASLGRRITDFTRALTGTYYSFILYDKALKKDEVEQNFILNVERYKTTK